MSLVISLIGFTALAMMVHELGHLLAARSCNVAASELGLTRQGLTKLMTRLGID